MLPAGHKDLVGKQFGRLTITHHVENKNRTSYWGSKCECGNSRNPLAYGRFHDAPMRLLQCRPCISKIFENEPQVPHGIDGNPFLFPLPAHLRRKPEIVAPRTMEQVPASIHSGRLTSRLRASSLDAHPVIRRLSDLLDERRLGRKEAARNAGLCESTVQNWFLVGSKPYMSQVGAIANLVGYRLTTERYGVMDRSLMGSRRGCGRRRYVCPDAYPFVHELVRLADKFDVSLEQAARSVDIKKSTLQAWTGNRCNVPSLERADAMLSVFGLRLALEPIPEEE